ncbi:hypothetical protein ES703_101292 [subsurface metagenome]
MLPGGKNGDPVLGHYGPNGQAAGQSLGQGHDIGFNAVLLVGKECPGAAQASLDFVQNEQNTRLVAPCPHPF